MGKFASFRQLKNVCLGSAHLKRLIFFYIQCGISLTFSIPWAVSTSRFGQGGLQGVGEAGLWVSSRQTAVLSLEGTAFTRAPLEMATQFCRLADPTTCHRVLRAAHGAVRNRSNSAGGSRLRESEEQPGGEKPMLTPSGLRLDTSAFCPQHPHHRPIAATHAHTHSRCSVAVLGVLVTQFSSCELDRNVPNWGLTD